EAGHPVRAAGERAAHRADHHLERHLQPAHAGHQRGDGVRTARRVARDEARPVNGTMETVTAILRIDPELLMFLPAARRTPERPIVTDGSSTLGHHVEPAGIPLTEVGPMTAGGRGVAASYVPRPGDVVEVAAVRRPQPLPEPRFLLDVHLGTLARRLRLLGLDTAYHNDMDDPALVEQANAERRVLLTQDRGLLRRRALWMGAYVR